MIRRDFLKFSGLFLASAMMPGLLVSCRSNNDPSAFDAFPQGVASGDPRATSLVIWTRALPNLLSQAHEITAEVALDEDFNTLILQQTFELTKESDYTLRVIVDKLQNNTVYYYRFINSAGHHSPIGRTLTAPSISDRSDLHFAFASCQNRRHGFYSAYRQMITDDQMQPADQQFRFVLHLGDFIYETNNDPLMNPLDKNGNPIEGDLVDQNGNKRSIGPFPDGGSTPDNLSYAETLDDYRHLYREYLSDPDLQEARARWPFIHTWDDHEFSDDCWQSEANYIDSGANSSTDEPSQLRKVAANQAWFEYLPVNLFQLDDVDPDLRHAKEFEFATVQKSRNTTVDDSNFANNADNIAAINTMTIYRSFRFGALMDLILTDNRSYRSDHAVPEDISGNSSLFVDPRMVMPRNLVNQLDAGKTDNNGDPSLFIFSGSLQVNPRFNRPPGTVLGAAQKQWWKDLMSRSKAPWKLWGNSVPLMRSLVNLSSLNTGLPDVYATERNELMNFLLSNNIENVVSLSGDVHAHFAGSVMNHYDVQAPGTSTPAATEFVCAGISSVSMFSAVRKRSEREPNRNRNLIAKPDQL